MSSAAASSSSSPPPPAAGPDKLLSLLPEILDSILSRLPLEQVVRTCCLSRAWRCRWESVPGLDLRFPPDYSAAAVANVLSRCAAPVRSFDIRVRLRHCPRAAYWLRTLASKRVRALTLSFDYSSRGEFPGVGRAIFSCEELTRLSLYHCEVPRAPHVFEGFPDLTKLVLAQINLPFNGGGALLQRLIAAGPNLAVLCLYDVSIDAPNGGSERWATRAPNLRILKLDMAIDNGCRIGEELPLLEEADISIDCLLGTQDFLDTFRRIASVKVLKFESNDALFAENPLEGISWKFWNLRRLALSANFGKISSILSIFSLLRCAPHIEKLDIEVDARETLVDEIDEGFLNAETSDDLFTTLKHVSLNDIKCFSNEMCFIKLLLSKTSSLESFEVSVFSASLMSCEEACAELATYRKASSLAKVEVTHSKKPALMMDAYF